MARKTLLTEGEIRQFMKLANLGPLGNEKIQEMGGMPYNRDAEEEAMGDELSGMDAEADREGDEIDDLEGDLDVADDEIADDDIDMSGLGDDEKQDMMADIVRAVAKTLGIEDQVSVEAGSEGGEDLDDPAGGMEDLEAGAIEMEPADDVAGDMGAMGGEEEIAVGAEEEEEEVPPGMRNTYQEGVEDELEEKEGHDDEIVAEVARRVAARLQQDNEREAMVDALAERIMKRLTK